jgi:hypothetical protein
MRQRGKETAHWRQFREIQARQHISGTALNETAASLPGARPARIPEGASKGHVSAYPVGAPDARAGGYFRQVGSRETLGITGTGEI